MDKLTHAIKRATGLRIADFCHRVLGQSHKQFLYRLNAGNIRAEDIKLIIALTGQSFHELFGYADPDRVERARAAIAEPTASIPSRAKPKAEPKAENIQGKGIGAKPKKKEAEPDMDLSFIPVDLDE